MEQRILKYRKQIDEWLAEMEQSMQAQSQEGGNAEQHMPFRDDGNGESVTQTQAKNADSAEQITQELVRNKLKEHLVQVGFFQHERLIHLIVTVPLHC